MTQPSWVSLYSMAHSFIELDSAVVHVTPKDELPRSVGAQYATGDQWINNSRKNEGMEQSKNNTQFWMGLVIEAKSDAVKSNIP